MTAPPRASVLMPIHNGERYLENAVQSVLRQTFSDFELLLLIDGSTDRSHDIAERLVQQDARCKLYSWPKRGLVATRNQGIDLAQGEILICMDCDDVSRSDRFERQISHLDAHAGCVAVGSRVLLIDPDDMPICEFISELTHDEIDTAHLSGRGGSRICQPAVAMRRHAVLQVGKYRVQYEFAEEIDLFLRLAEIGSIANLPDVLLEYRQHIKSVGYAHGVEQRRRARSAMEAACTRRGIAPPPPASEPAWIPETPADAHRKWAWWALTAGNVATARKHARKALIAEPLSSKSLKLVACAIRGY
jgi:glycosyltransferase involved in cell wall biosynthesis